MRLFELGRLFWSPPYEAVMATFCLPKIGFLNPTARPIIGNLFIADISIPPRLYKRVGQARTLFQKDALVKVWRAGRRGSARPSGPPNAFEWTAADDDG